MFCAKIIKRSISTTAACYGKKNFRKFPLYNKRGTRIYKQQLASSTDPDIQIDKRGVRDVGYYTEGDKFIQVPEMVPELIVPDLKDCKLQPYVSYRTPDVMQSEFTAEDLFNVVYAPKISKDLKENKLDEDLMPLEPSAEEQLTPEDAKILARKTGSDIF